MMVLLEKIIPALFFYLLPLVIGGAAWRLVRKDNQAAFPLVTSFVIGALIIFLNALLIRYLFLPFLSQLNFGQIFQPVLIVIFGLSVIVHLILPKKIILISARKYLQQVGLSLLLAILASVIWNRSSPYPLNWDFLEHQTLVNNILAGRYSFMTSQITDTFIFNGYSSLFHTLMAASQLLMPADILSYWQSISFIHLFLVIFASYLLALAVTDNKGIAFLSAVISAFVFETVAFTSLFFIPQTLTALVFIFLLTQLFIGTKQNRFLPVWIILLGGFFLVISHYIIGFVAAAFYLGTYFLLKYQSWLYPKINSPLLLEIAFIVLISLILLSPLFPSGYLNQGEGEFFNFTFTQKLQFLQEAYGYSFLLFLPLGIFWMVKGKKMPEIIILVLGTLSLVLVFLQMSYVFKFYVLGRFFINLIMAAGIYGLLQQIPSIFIKKVINVYFLVILALIFLANSLYWKSILNYQHYLTSISPGEVEAAEFLRSKYRGTGALLISDPATQNILEALSGVNSQGGAYANYNTRTQLIKLGKSSGLTEIKNQLYEINDALQPSTGPRLFALSGRYFRWQKEDIKNKKALHFNIWKPSDLTFNDYKYLTFLLSDPHHFNLVYRNSTLAVIEVSP